MIEDAVLGELKAKIKGASLPRRVKFDLGGNDILIIDGATISQEDGPADVTLTLSQADLSSILSGDLNPQMAFMTGRLKVAGDMSLAMQLASALG
ncbi:MAG: SCP2 sterol-binding domain-containing protein [Sphingomonadales bacterium]|nr:SCP2 sterol-binding domain-containing protein [Sphingomonadales bacterium]